MAVCGRDQPDLFLSALESVFDNTLLPDEFILVIDGPAPTSVEELAIAAQTDHAAKIIRIPHNQGLATALNTGLAEVTTEWVVRADADDFNHPERFLRLAELVRSNHQLDLVGTSIMEYDQNGRPIASRKPPLEHDKIANYIKRRNPFNHMSVAYKHDLAERCGGYPDIYRREDYALWAKMLHAGARCANLPDPLVHVTAGDDMYRRRGGIRHVLAERDLQLLLVRLAIKSPSRAFLDGISRSLVFIAPNTIRKLVYLRLLRHHPARPVK